MGYLTGYIAAAFTVVVIGACAGSGWTAEERASMLESCETRFADDDGESEGFCGCVVDYLALRYSLDEVDQATIGKAVDACG